MFPKAKLLRPVVDTLVPIELSGRRTAATRQDVGAKINLREERGHISQHIRWKKLLGELKQRFSYIISLRNLMYMYASRPAVGIIDFEGSLSVGKSHPHGVTETGCDLLEGTGRYVPGRGGEISDSEDSKENIIKAKLAYEGRRFS
jgi:hypothetical protein